MVNYSNTKIYKIMSHLGDKIYIGSTTKQYLSQRMDNHRNSYKRWQAGVGSLTKSYEVFDEYGVENCEIILIESYPCNSKDEALKKEADYIRQFECVNKSIPGRSEKEYRQENKDKVSKWGKTYRGKNKDKLDEKSKKYYEDNKERMKEEQRKRYELNKEKVKEYQQQRYIMKKQKETDQN